MLAQGTVAEAQAGVDAETAARVKKVCALNRTLEKTAAGQRAAAKRPSHA